MPSRFTAVRNGIDTAISIKETFDPSALPPMSSAGKQLTYISPMESSQVGSNVVIGRKEGDFGELSREFWQEKALKAEKKIQELEEINAVQKDELIEMRNALKKASGLKEGFAANSDLAQIAVRETQALASRAIIDGLKPEFNTLPKINKNVEELTAKINALSKLPDMVANLVELPAKVSALEASIDASVVRSIEGEDARNSDSENISCSIKRAHRLMADFGFSSENKAINVPNAVSSILSLVRSEFSAPAHDTSRPPPSVPGPSSSTGHDDYHRNPRNNNNPSPGGLMSTTSGSGDFHPVHVPYPPPYPPVPNYGSAHDPGHSSGHGHSYDCRSPPFYGSGQHGHGHSPGYEPGHGHAHQQHHDTGNHGKRNYPFEDLQRNVKK